MTELLKPTKLTNPVDQHKYVYAIRNKEGKYILLDSRFVHWLEMPNAQFWETKEKAKAVIDYFFNEQEYNPIEHDVPLEIVGFEINWQETEKEQYEQRNLT